MKNNMGTIDKLIRILIATVIVILYATDEIYGIPGIILLIFAGIFIVTSVIGFCPLYQPLKINTRGKEQEPDQDKGLDL
jgi:hypothetical protein